jgi:hypothetical protein
MHLKMTQDMLLDVMDKKKKYQLSLTQCCFYLNNKYQVELSRQRMNERIICAHLHLL